MWEGSIQENESLIFLFVCLEVEIFLRAMRPTSSDGKANGRRLDMIVKAAALCLIKILLQYVKVLGSKHTFTLSVDNVSTGYCVSVHFRKHSVIWGG